MGWRRDPRDTGQHGMLKGEAESWVYEVLGGALDEYSSLLSTNGNWAVVAEQAKHNGELYWSSRDTFGEAMGYKVPERTVCREMRLMMRSLGGLHIAFPSRVQLIFAI